MDDVAALVQGVSHAWAVGRAVGALGWAEEAEGNHAEAWLLVWQLRIRQNVMLWPWCAPVILLCAGPL